jgi:general secretion pathway protein K
MTGPERRRGMVLVMVLWSIALLSALAMAASVTFRGFAGIAAVGRDRVQGEALFTAGLEVAAGMVTGSGDRPFTELETTVKLSTGVVRARLSDEGGRIDIGKAPVEVLTSLLRAVGASDAQASGAAQRIVEWRNSDATGSPNAATQPANGAAPQLANGAAPQPANSAVQSLGLNQPFADVGEIAQIPGVAPAWVAAMEPLTTVFGSETVNPLTAPASVIAALPGVDRGLLESFLAVRRSSPSDADRIMAALLPAQRFLAPKREQVVAVELAAALPDGYGAAAHAVMVLMPRDTQPYRVLVWKPLPPSRLR